MDHTTQKSENHLIYTTQGWELSKLYLQRTQGWELSMLHILKQKNYKNVH